MGHIKITFQKIFATCANTYLANVVIGRQTNILRDGQMYMQCERGRQM